MSSHRRSKPHRPPLPPRPKVTYTAPDVGYFDWIEVGLDAGDFVRTPVESAVHNPTKGLLRMRLVGGDATWEVMFRQDGDEWVGDGRDQRLNHWRAEFHDAEITFEGASASGKGTYWDGFEGRQTVTGRFEFHVVVEIRGPKAT
ncbi:MAG: hypothetical protein DRI90_19155 [Deltaproteobacteria bacterium]|nr:MAG: hypothetical protein DRI90_19155 [Deltaproteobacteria bacterium]